MEKHKKREHEISSENKEKGKGKELRNIANFSGENFEITDEEDDENKVEIEEIENEVGVIVQVNRPHVPIPDYSSYDDKTRLEAADNSTYDDKLSIESAVTVSHNDNLRIETVEELEEINITEKQKVKELEIRKMTDKDVKLSSCET